MKKLTLTLALLGILNSQAQLPADSIAKKTDTVYVNTCKHRCCHTKKQRKEDKVWNIVSFGLFAAITTLAFLK